MGLFKWEERLTRKISKRNLKLAIQAKILIVLSLGSLFSIELVKYGYYILLLSFIVILIYIQNNFFKWYNKEKINFPILELGSFGMFLLALFTGIQSPQIPFKIYILILGIILIIPAIINIFK